jgi:phosphatidylethanolamine/phosphatidyl-N-methylethanolamine N-methyltransferase
MGSVSPKLPGGAALRGRQFLVFARNFLRHPLTVGTFAPSSPFLVRRLMRAIDWSRVRTVVEYGPGVGTITTALLRRMHEDARLLVIESNGEFCAFMQQHLDDPRLFVEHGSAEHVQESLAKAGLGGADLVVSGIPFSTMPGKVRARVLDATADALSAHGQFLVYQYTRSVLPHLEGRFRVVSQDTEWRNAWPMRLFLCEKSDAAVEDGDAPIVS